MYIMLWGHCMIPRSFNPLKTKPRLFYLRTQFVSSSKHFSSLIIKANEMYNFSNLFDKVFYMFRTGPLSIIRSISTL